MERGSKKAKKVKNSKIAKNAKTGGAGVLPVEAESADSGSVTIAKIENKIIEVKSQNVILDTDVAELYGVETREVNQAVKNNPNKFPKGYIFQLTHGEWKSVKSKILISPLGGGKVKLPKAFTEKGLYMLATILKGNKAIKTTITIIETFAKLRNLTRNIKELSITRDKVAQKALMQKSGGLVAEILNDELEISGSETAIELNFAVLKVKHTVKKTKK